MELLKIFKTSIQAKISPFFTKIKMWLTPNYLKNKVFQKIRMLFKELLDVKPKDKNDYYAVGNWLVSKKLAYTIVIAVFLCGISYILISMPEQGYKEAAYPTYKYNALALKFQSNKVCILGKSGYKAYIGEVDNGVVCGQGTLYNKEGNIVYEGAFEANAYNGTGKRYYDNTMLWYEGEFKDNQFHGEGTLYSENGSLRYIGEFKYGNMDGKGSLYNENGNDIYTGTFQQNFIRYAELPGKETAAVSKMYTGEREVYQTNDQSCVIMPEIQAGYYAESGENSLDEEWKVKGVYVFQNEIFIDGRIAKNIPEVIEILGEPEYEGNTKLGVVDAVMLNAACELYQTNNILFGKPKLQINQVLDDVMEVENYKEEYLTYLYVFQKENIAYTFFTREKNGEFAFYLLEE